MAGKTEYKNNWQRENVDRINLTVPKGQKETIKAHAESRGESVNGFINRVITEAIERERVGDCGCTEPIPLKGQGATQLDDAPK